MWNRRKLVRLLGAAPVAGLAATKGFRWEPHPAQERSHTPGARHWHDHVIYGPFHHPKIQSMIGPRIYTVRVPDVNPRNVTQIVIHTDLQTATIYVKDQVDPYVTVKAYLQLTQP